MTTDQQLSLQLAQPFQPVPAGERGYVPVLQSKPGERDALRFASPEVWSRMTPLIEIVGPKSPGREPFKRERVRNWVKQVADVVRDRPCFVDVLRLNPRHQTITGEGKDPVLAVIAEEARKRGLAWVPVARVKDPKTVRGLVADAAACGGRGAAIRHQVLGTVAVDQGGAKGLIAEVLAQLGTDISNTDLLLDLDFISEDIEIEAADLAEEVGDLAAMGSWRNIVLMGTAMHRSLGNGVVKEGTVGRLPRREWDLWVALRALGLPRNPTFGDYAVQHPKPPADEESSGPGMRANVRYTLDEVTLVPRGVGPLQQEGAHQYRKLCHLIADDPDFAGADYTWGDRRILECADGYGDVGSQNDWRGAGTSHHLRHVLDQMDRLFTEIA